MSVECGMWSVECGMWSCSHSQKYLVFCRFIRNGHFRKPNDKLNYTL